MAEIAQVFQDPNTVAPPTPPVKPMAGSLAAYYNFNPTPNVPAADKMRGMQPQLVTPLTQFMNDAKAQGHNIGISSGYRDPAQQQQLWNAALQKYGNEQTARLWVAPPGQSNHNRGLAADLSYDSPAATQWAHDNAARYGLNFPLGNEAWHIEPVGIRNAAPTTTASIPASSALPAPSSAQDSKASGVSGASTSPVDFGSAAQPPQPQAASQDQGQTGNLASIFAGLAKAANPTPTPSAPPQPTMPLPGLLNGSPDPRAIAAALTAQLPGNLILA